MVAAAAAPVVPAAAAFAPARRSTAARTPSIPRPDAPPTDRIAGRAPIPVLSRRSARLRSDQTVPGGTPRTSAISAGSRPYRQRRSATPR